jgi:radical SAM superfamily enzyme YgiQ (UPF0313 family)
VVALYEDDFNYLSKMCLTNVRRAAFEKARLARERGAKVVVHGSDATDRVEEYLRAPIDVAVLGEGEESLAELVGALARERRPDSPGLAFLDGGEVVRTAPRSFIRDLDGLPFPAWDLVAVERYREAWRERHDFFSVNMVTTRGCPYHCNWCAKPIYGQRYGVRSPSNVADELAWIRRTVRPDHVWYADDIFGLKPDWVASFASEVEARGCRLPFKIQARADLIDDGVAAALARAGCENVWMGAESGSQKILDAMEKGVKVAQIHAAAASLKSHGIRVSLFLQFGYPGEDWSDIEKTLGMVRNIRPDDIGISVSYPLPGTPFYERVRREMGEKTNWAHSDDLDLMFRGTYGRDFYRALYELAHSEFRFRRALSRPRSYARAARSLLRWVPARLEVARRKQPRHPAASPSFPFS